VLRGIQLLEESRLPLAHHIPVVNWLFLIVEHHRNQLVFGVISFFYHLLRPKGYLVKKSE
jgi:hypothetical protein